MSSEVEGGVTVLGRLPPGVSAARLAALGARTVRALGLDGGQVNLRFAGDRTVRGFNRRFRGVDRPTDVLSFPAGGRTPLGRLQAAGGEGGFLGDLLISRDRARVQARRAGLSLGREVEELVLHGLLHLLGYDHERDQGEMDRLELRLRAELLDRRSQRSGARWRGPRRGE